jgi:Zn-dependent protease
MPTNKGSFKIFTLAGIGVYVHWSWFLVAYYCVQYRTNTYSSMTWNVLEYLSLFLIVLMHEFGHQLACRQVGGQTHDIVLWPLGGVAYVSPPQRPGAQLWSIAAGPLVNVVLVPLLAIVVSACWHAGLSESHRDVYELLHNVWYINLGLLIFNLLPIYPLDGGPNRAFAALVSVRSRQEFVGGKLHRFHRRGGIDRVCNFREVRLDWNHVRVHRHELLERLETSPGLGARGQTSTPQ